MRQISKRDIYGGRMSENHFAAGRAMEQKMFRGAATGDGRFTNGTMDAEAMAPKTWILWKNTARGEEIATIECEIHRAPSVSDPSKAAGMLVGQCPVCWRDHGQANYFHVHEENKQLSLDWVEYGKLPSNHHLAINWAYHCRYFLGGRSPRSEDKIAIVSSPERWMCDYCKGWCVRVTDSVAITDTSGATMLYLDLAAKSR